MHPDNQIFIFKVYNKNVNENLTYENERQMYYKLKYSWLSLLTLSGQKEIL